MSILYWQDYPCVPWPLWRASALTEKWFLIPNTSVLFPWSVFMSANNFFFFFLNKWVFLFTLHIGDGLKFTVLLKPVLKIVTWQTDTTLLLCVFCRWQVAGCSYSASLYSDSLRSIWMNSSVAVSHLSFMYILWICSKMFSADNWVRCWDSAVK